GSDASKGHHRPRRGEAVGLGHGLSRPGRCPPHRRLVRVMSYYPGQAINPFARPIEGVVVLVDTNEKRVVEVSDRVIVPLAE
ncbi:MAG: hypothetical protein C4321_11365, partial [Chloroflexota bacterium]